MAGSKEVAKTSSSVESLIDPEQTLKASKALLAHIQKAAKENATSAPKRNILDQDDGDVVTSAAETPIWLTVTTKRHIFNSTKLTPKRVAVPHPLNTNTDSTICIISADPQRYYKNIVASDEFPAELRERITRVIDMTHLKKKFREYETQRQLFSAHDIFLADDRITNRLPKALGKTFYKSSAKRPVPVVFHKKQPTIDGKRVKRGKGQKDENFNARPVAEIVKEIQDALGAALVNLSPSTNTSIRVAYAGWKPKMVAANVEALVNALVEKHVPQQWSNVKSIFIKGPETIALPIYQTDALWLEDKDVVGQGTEEHKALEESKEKANIGKKRKTVTEAEVEEQEVEESKPSKKKKKLPESNDDRLDAEIAERKAKLKKQKKAAKAAVEA